MLQPEDYILCQNFPEVLVVLQQYLSFDNHQENTMPFVKSAADIVEYHHFPKNTDYHSVPIQEKFKQIVTSSITILHGKQAMIEIIIFIV